MGILLDLIVQILPLYATVCLGYAAGRYFGVTKESIAALLIYFIAPLVIFNGVATATLDATLVLLPLLFFCLASLMGAVYYLIGGFMWHGTEKNILAFTAGTGNTGYFGIPVVLALFGEQYLAVTVLSILGFVLYENSVGYYFVARGHLSVREALYKIVKLPTIYAFLLGVVFLSAHAVLSETVSQFLANFRGAYSVLGMMLVGIGLVGVSWDAIDNKFLLSTFSAKFIAWPIAVVCIIMLDATVFHILAPTVYPILLLLSIVPLASNTVAFAAQLNASPEKAAVAVLLSTIFALLYIPLVVTFLFPIILST